MRRGPKVTTSLLFSPSSVPHNNTPVFMPLRRQACRVIWIISKRLPSVGEGEGGGGTRTLYISEGDHNHVCFLVHFWAGRYLHYNSLEVLWSFSEVQALRGGPSHVARRDNSEQRVEIIIQRQGIYVQFYCVSKGKYTWNKKHQRCHACCAGPNQNTHKASRTCSNAGPRFVYP